MKLIIKEYLASLNERKELDALLPDLLSQMGLRVFSRPGIGSRQYGVDIAAVGKIDDGPETVYLLSVKSGDLGRTDWDGGSVQALRPSLNDILDVYIPTHLPSEHHDKPIEICICLGGDIREEVRLSITQYEKEIKTDSTKLVEWDGDFLASKVEKYFLQEELLPKGIQPLLRKALALLDEPQASFAHFSKLVTTLSGSDLTKDSHRLTAIRQMNICLWILFAWAREGGNFEAAYLTAEFTLLHAWEVSKQHFKKRSKAAKSIQLTCGTILSTYQTIAFRYLSKSILPYTNKKHGLSTAVHSSEHVDVNLKMFDVLGRLSMAGIWAYWRLCIDKTNPERQRQHEAAIHTLSESLKQLINNNPALLLPIKDEQAIDISLALHFFSFQETNTQYSLSWLTEMLNRAIFAYKTHGPYPCVHRSYIELLEHPERNNESYREEATVGSILYPTIALWAALLNDESLYKGVQQAQEEHFPHCTFQFWYPGDTTEEHLYRNSSTHGAALVSPPMNKAANDFLKILWEECDHSTTFKSLSCVDSGMWPLLLIACRHYRLPMPIDFTLDYREQALKTSGAGIENGPKQTTDKETVLD